VVIVAAVAAVLGGVRLVRNALQPGPGVLPPITPVHAYHVVYDETFQGNVVRVEDDTVERPYHALSLTKDGTKPISGDLTNDDGFWVFNDRGWGLINPAPQRASDDPQPALGLAAGLHIGEARVIGHDTIVGRMCTVVRTGGPVGSALTKATSSNHVDICLDSSGVMLSYRWTLNGKLAQTKRASMFDPNPTITSATFVPTPAPAADRRVSVVKATGLSDASRAKLDPQLDPPASLRFDGGWVRVEALSSSLQVTTTLLYRSGSDGLVTVDYNSSGQTPTGTKISLRGGRTAYLQLGLDLTRLLVPINPNSSITIEGVDPAEVRAVADALRDHAPSPPSTAAPSTTTG